MADWWRKLAADWTDTWRRFSSSDWEGFAGSLILHGVVLLVLALYILPVVGENMELADITAVDLGAAPDLAVADVAEISAERIGSPVELPQEDILNPNLIPSPIVRDEPNLLQMDFGPGPPRAPLNPDAPSGPNIELGELGGRSQQARAALTKAFGGTPESEAAVEAGLQWLLSHQRPDGSWNFNHTTDYCDGTCTAPGQLEQGTIAATSLALLSFVGAGHTQEEGRYKDAVRLGLSYMLRYGNSVNPRGDFRQLVRGNAGMYSQGLATILLCETYGLTRDEDVGRQAKAAVKFVLDAQNPDHGGWRYEIKDRRGDTSVLGWQVMALTSARMCRIAVPARARTGAEKFLNSVSAKGGAYYGYTHPEDRPSTTAVGLLCRMYHGWNNDNTPLREGVLALSQRGPSRDDMYYNYYATQVLHHWGGEEWTKWNEVMREELISTQQKDGHSVGSWYPRDPHAGPGGRLYMTTLAVMTLEVYYRHLPIYQKRSVDMALGVEDGEAKEEGK